jgi:hypothetical protein
MQHTEIFVPKSLAMELRKKGFNETCVGWYNSDHENDSTKPIVEGDLSKNSEFVSSCTSPTYDQVVGWFASKHNMYMSVIICDDQNDPVDYAVNVWKKREIIVEGEWQNNRQQSLLTAFEEALKLI